MWFIYLLVTKLNFTVSGVFDADDIDASLGLPKSGDTNIHSKPEQFSHIKIVNQIEIMLWNRFKRLIFKVWIVNETINLNMFLSSRVQEIIPNDVQFPWADSIFLCCFYRMVPFHSLSIFSSYPLQLRFLPITTWQLTKTF